MEKSYNFKIGKNILLVQQVEPKSLANCFARRKTMPGHTNGAAAALENWPPQKEWIAMNKHVGPAVTGLAVTMAVGTAAYLASKSMRKNTFKKSAGKALRAVEGMVDNVASMMK